MPTGHLPKAQDFRVPANIPTKAHGVCQNIHGFCPRRSSWEGKVGGTQPADILAIPVLLLHRRMKLLLRTSVLITVRTVNHCQDCTQTTCSRTAPRIQEQRGARHKTGSGQNSLQLSDIQKTMPVARNLLLASTAAVT